MKETGYAPAELLVGRKFRSRLPQLPEPNTRQDVTKARQCDEIVKAKQKVTKDSKANVKPHSIEVTNQVLLKQRPSKLKPPYDPDPYTVTEVTGHQVTAARGDKILRRDAQKWKVFKE